MWWSTFKHPQIEMARMGQASLAGVDATADEHNWGNWESEYTSWTTEKEIANFQANKSGLDKMGRTGLVLINDLN